MLIVFPAYNFRVRKDVIRRRLFAKKEFSRLLLKQYRDITTTAKERLSCSIKLSRFKKNSSISRVRNTCVLTGRARSTYSYFHLTRTAIRKLGNFGLLLGVRKSSW